MKAARPAYSEAIGEISKCSYPVAKKKKKKEETMFRTGYEDGQYPLVTHVIFFLR